jgi:hypothetical protein
MFTPTKERNSTLKIKTVPFGFERFFRNSLLLACSIFIGAVFKMFWTLDPKWVTKRSYITGLPIIRDWYFIGPLILNILFIIQLFILYSNQTVKNAVGHDFFKFLKKMHFGHFFTNLVYLATFYMLYYKLYLPMWKHYEFRISGHMLAATFCSSILSNIQALCDGMKDNSLKKTLMGYIDKVCRFLIYHNLYSLVWTTWVFHRTSEVIVSFLISFVYVIIINALNIDRLIAQLLYGRSYKNIQKNKII